MDRNIQLNNIHDMTYDNMHTTDRVQCENNSRHAKMIDWISKHTEKEMEKMYKLLKHILNNDYVSI